MKDTMRAAVLRRYHEPLQIEEKPIPVPGPGEVLVKVRASGLCVSDIHIQDGKIGTVHLPYTPGHEMAGVIVAVGKGVDPARIGEHISAAIDIVCGECEFCRTGRTNLCRSLVRIGFERDGSHEEYCVIPAKNAFTVNPTIPFEEITGIPDAVGCMYNGLKNQAKLGIGQTLLILGVGGLGMNAIQIAKLMGATVYATSRKADKLEVAKQMGADAVIDTSCEDLRTRVAELTNGRGVDVVLDNIGLEWSINEGVYMVRPGGKVLVCGYISKDFKVNYQEVMKFEKEILGMRGMTRQDMAEVVELVNQRKVVAYRYEGAEVHTDEVATITVERGYGPRYGEFAPNGKDFYLINEIGSRVMHYRYNAGKMTLCEETSTLPYGFTGENICSDLHITADGKFLYASNRGHDSITAYHILEDGSLAWIECQPSGGKTPRNFALDRTGCYLLAENQDSDNITVFAIGADGRLTKGETYDFGSPVCIRFFQKTAF